MAALVKGFRGTLVRYFREASNYHTRPFGLFVRDFFGKFEGVVREQYANRIGRWLVNGLFTLVRC